MRGLRRRATALTSGLASAVSTPTASGSPQKAFVKTWEGRRVIVRQPLYTLVYNERGRLGNTHSGKRAGLTVVTPFAGTYFQFAGKHSEDDITGRDPQRVLEAVAAKYQRAHALDVGSFQKIAPVLLDRYDVGFELVVRAVRIERDTVRLSFVEAENRSPGASAATTLTIKWPVPLSESFSERGPIENLIRWFVDVKETRQG